MSFEDPRPVRSDNTAGMVGTSRAVKCETCRISGYDSLEHASLNRAGVDSIQPDNVGQLLDEGRVFRQLERRDAVRLQMVDILKAVPEDLRRGANASGSSASCAVTAEANARFHSSTSRGWEQDCLGIVPRRHDRIRAPRVRGPEMLDTRSRTRPGADGRNPSPRAGGGGRPPAATPRVSDGRSTCWTRGRPSGTCRSLISATAAGRLRRRRRMPRRSNAAGTLPRAVKGGCG